MVCDFYKVEIPADLAGAMLCAILSDTVLFKSPTCTTLDKVAAEQLAKIAGIEDVNALGMDMFKAKSNLNASPRDLIFRDFKDFDMGGNKIGIGQLELISLDMIDSALMDALKQELAKVKSEGRHSAVLVLTDIMKEGSAVLVVSDEESKVLGALGATENGAWLAGVMSRKKQVVPPLQLEPSGFNWFWEFKARDSPWLFTFRCIWATNSNSGRLFPWAVAKLVNSEAFNLSLNCHGL